MEPETSCDAPRQLNRPQIIFEELTFSDGTTITLDPKDVVVFVGPNNAGKSVALRELENHIGPRKRGKVIKAVKIQKHGAIDDLIGFLEQHSDINAESIAGFRFNLRMADVGVQWQQMDSTIRRVFCTRIATENRITDSDPQKSIEVSKQPPTHPIHLLYSDDRLAERLSGYFRRGFGEDLIILYGGGSVAPLLTGQRPALDAGEDRVSSTYIKRLRAATVPLKEQGDGMRSFASVILHMLAPSTQSVLLLDEPEAFLHPPQARLLGEFIAKENLAYAQLFVATHSPDVLQGLLNAAPEHLRVMRIQRDGAINRVKELDKERARAISSDPLMKFSSVMSGIFHQRVIVCEADADCMFYSAILDLSNVCGERHPDVLFTQAGGKGRMALIVEALRALDVTVDVVADIDILKDEVVLKRVVEALGGDWTRIQKHAVAVRTAVEQKKPWLTSGEIAKGIRRIVENAPESGEFPKNLESDIKAVFKKASPWDAIKDAGRMAIPAGEATTHCEQLQSLCQAFGLWIVPVGELEGFCKLVGGHGPGWVQDVVEKHDLANDEQLGEARDFMRRLWTSRPSVSVAIAESPDGNVPGQALEGNSSEAEGGARRCSDS